MPAIEITEARRGEQLEQAFAIRRAVFVDEQGVSETLEFDGRDDNARHLLALRNGEAVGTLRVRWLNSGQVAKIERVAVLPQARGAGVGHALVEAALTMARAAGAATARLHSQTRVQRFYARLGFVAFGPEFMEDGLPHIAMQRSLRQQTTRARGGMI